MSPSSTALKGWVVLHSGCCGASAFTRSSAKASWVYIGCSTHSVPSLSNTAMRSGSGTKSGEPSLVTFSTKATMAAFGAVSFHDGRGSVWARAGATTSRAAARPALSDGQFEEIIRREHVELQVASASSRLCSGTGGGRLSGRRRISCRSARYVDAPGLPPRQSLPGFSSSSTRSSEKLPTSCRGGNSLKVARNWATKACAGTRRKTRSILQWP